MLAQLRRIRFHWNRPHLPHLPRLPHIPLFYVWLAGLTIVLIGGARAAYLVFTQGLAVTNLTDQVPWGLWITIDLSSIAMSAGAFSLSAAVYLLGLKQLRPVARVAVFVGLIGYTMALLTLLLDIGRPDRFWHALVYWNTHSVLWEVTMCVTLYLSVLLVEFAPLLGEATWMRERFPLPARILRALHHAAPALAVFGMFLSLLHQSSLGATYGVLKARPVWYKPDMSMLFIVTALTGGPALTVLAAMLVGKLRGAMTVDRALLERVAQVIGFTLLVYLYMRFWDSFIVTYTYSPGRNEGLNLMTNGLMQWNFWLGEMLLGVIIPVVILLSPRRRADDRLLMLALALIVMGVILFRWDTNIAGQLFMVAYTPSTTAPVLGQIYSPNWVEWAAGLGVVAYGLLFFSLGARFLPVFTPATHE
jgi:Ni/Fe-hydrogenase subunit HybB-like protein